MFKLLVVFIISLIIVIFSCVSMQPQELDAYNKQKNDVYVLLLNTYDLMCNYSDLVDSSTKSSIQVDEKKMYRFNCLAFSARENIKVGDVISINGRAVGDAAIESNNTNAANILRSSLFRRKKHIIEANIHKVTDREAYLPLLDSYDSLVKNTSKLKKLQNKYPLFYNGFFDLLRDHGWFGFLSFFFGIVALVSCIKLMNLHAKMVDGLYKNKKSI
jgi:hypothetical protein